MSTATSQEHLKNIIRTLPGTPGIYQMFDTDGTCLYVGKAKNLKNRVSSYFQKNTHQSIKVKKMVSQVASILYTEVSSELEALILESNFIKELRPKYNILLRDDKHFCYIKITTNEDYPRIMVVRKVLKDNAYYFGPKTSAAQVYKMLKILRKLFPYRSCDLDIIDKQTHVEIAKKTIPYPCLYYHIKRCIGPCIIPCKDEYRQIIETIIDFLKGNHKQITDRLHEKMASEAKERRFEQAMKTRDILQGIESLLEKQVIDQADIISQDVIFSMEKWGKFFITLLQVRQGKIIGKEHFIMDQHADFREEEETRQLQKVVEHFLWSYYQQNDNHPEELLLSMEIENKDLFLQWMKSQKKTGKQIKLLLPKKGTKHQLLELARKNTENYAEQQRIASMSSGGGNTKEACTELQEALGLTQFPARIECYDISHLGGTHTVASMVVFKDGQPDKKSYRRFKLRSLEENKIDDFASMKEILERRGKHLKTPSENQSFSQEPNLIIIDGGKGQLSSVMEVMEEMQLTHIPIISLAKREEEVFLPYTSNPLVLPRTSRALYLLQNIRDEAHRFAVSYNRNLRITSQKKSQLDSISGIGPKTKKVLLKTFGDLQGIKSASFEELATVIGEQKAQLIISAL